ncbi:hypothetical protein F0562_032207 [Nyssa sinensis]|uniref:Protein kinase domain-containing protein n=1 Tax=Nyssa sinensis TaxID=561372 RepID=A0A5J5AWP0_9ASTE|nr:hypothetical protein F0562_032207 [Nyssa sinensis]
MMTLSKASTHTTVPVEVQWSVSGLKPPKSKLSTLRMKLAEDTDLDKNFTNGIGKSSKVADFGLTKLIEVGSSSLHTRLVGTFGYMPPEYAQYGDVSSKTDAYAFGVVLYELISAKEAIVKTNEVVTESKGLVSLFEGVLSQPNPRKNLQNYSIDSVLKHRRIKGDKLSTSTLIFSTSRPIKPKTLPWVISSFTQFGVVRLKVPQPPTNFRFFEDAANCKP